MTVHYPFFVSSAFLLLFCIESFKILVSFVFFPSIPSSFFNVLSCSFLFFPSLYFNISPSSLSPSSTLIFHLFLFLHFSSSLSLFLWFVFPVWISVIQIHWIVTCTVGILKFNHTHTSSSLISSMVTIIAYFQTQIFHTLYHTDHNVLLGAQQVQERLLQQK